jgi:hypothetical protein
MLPLALIAFEVLSCVSSSLEWLLLLEAGWYTTPGKEMLG